MILLVDNYDSFTYNLVQRLGETDPELDLRVYRNDKITLDEIEALGPSHLIVSLDRARRMKRGFPCRASSGLPAGFPSWGFVSGISR